MKNIIITLLFLGVISCQEHNNQTPVASTQDYEALMAKAAEPQQNLTQSDIEFWQNKLKNEPQNITYLSKLASLYSSQFRVDGNIDHIYKADSIFELVAERNPFSNAATFQALGVNAITKHEFQKAREYAKSALSEGDQQGASYNLLFDASMEVGDYATAEGILNRYEQKNSFQYLIRASKMADHKGDLDLAIHLMEKAHERVKGNENLYLWSKSNLGDMYGHAGRITDSYNAYLDVLNKNAQHWHSWQGLAWIAYAKDGNVNEARRILKFVDQHHFDPQLKLSLAELADFEGNAEEAQNLKEEYHQIVSDQKYLAMYNKYLILLEAEDLNYPEVALARAEREKNYRPTPDMFDLLAWSHLKNGNKQKALEIAQTQVEGKTSEPDVIFHLGMIYLENGESKKAKTYLNEALEASYELGPITTQAVQTALSSL
ncbi:tetratricopeptide repeat protein [Roseivirga spongicola]|uniref:tetratricopeptide repeat protein n=1 Tax=Roseivirga spongicola TaxID=333140 RepID=UPI002AC9C7BF|nr:hypothetical protein [Roseivirga spongicola]WPZ12160.1 hypothetical protein T7867_08555 [Roseivirga spongicola]